MNKLVEYPPASGPHPDGSVPGGWWHQVDETGRIVCDLCPRACSLKPGDRGFCFVRENRDGEMVLTTYGRSTGFCIDPIEKKPFNHFYPGTSVLSFGTAGCNLGCKFCQNWDISKSREIRRLSEQATPEAIAAAAQDLGCASVAFTYNDPVIWAEYAIDVARVCRQANIHSVAVTAGYICDAARGPFFADIDAVNVDLKSFREDFYRKITYSHLQPVLDTLSYLKHETDAWLEITNLVIPGHNDRAQELREMCDWIVQTVGPDVPLHFSAFHPDFRMLDVPATPPESLIEAREIAIEAGVKYAYVGNVHDAKNDSTYCPSCGTCVIERDWYELGRYRLIGNACESCGATIAGRFAEGPGTWGRRRQPVDMRVYRNSQPKLNGNGSTRRKTDPLTEAEYSDIARWACASILLQMGEPAESVETSSWADKQVEGAFVTLKRDKQLRACYGSYGAKCGIADSVRRAAIHAVTRDTRFPPFEREELPELEVDVSLLSNLQPLNVAGSARADCVEVGRHGLIIRHPQGTGLLLPQVASQRSWDAETFLVHVCRKAGLPDDAWMLPETSLDTFEATVIHGSMQDVWSSPADMVDERGDDNGSDHVVSSNDEAAVRVRLRPPHCAGLFYPADVESRRALVDGQFARADISDRRHHAAIMVPHAGLRYSGSIAAATWGASEIPSSVLIISPKHTRLGENWAVFPDDGWSIPGVEIPNDLQLVQALCRGIRGLREDRNAHAQEHGIEVQLPYIERLTNRTRVSAIAIGSASLDQCLRFGHELANVLSGLPQMPLLVISSDMNHFGQDRENRRLDEIALAAMESLDPAHLYRTVVDQFHITMCGIRPAVIVCQALRELGRLNRLSRAGYATSGDVSGDLSRVVGYAGAWID